MSRGAKLCRTETVTVRLDPRLNYLCELAARTQRRTKSSFIEWAVQEAVKEASAFPGGKSLHEISNRLWHIDVNERMRRLKAEAPSLLTFDEEVALAEAPEAPPPQGDWKWPTPTPPLTPAPPPNVAVSPSGHKQSG